MTQLQLILDTETRSDRDLTKSGVYVYSETPATDTQDGYDLLLTAYKYRRGDKVWATKVWSPLENPTPPADLMRGLRDPKVLKVAHNASFDRVILSRLLYGHEDKYLDPREWRDTYAVAANWGLPRSLDKLVTKFGIEGKLSEGRSLIRFFNNFSNRQLLIEALNTEALSAENLDEVFAERPASLTAEGLSAVRARSGYGLAKKRLVAMADVVEKWDTYKAYNIHDVDILDEVNRLLPDMIPDEKRFWVLDQEINDRGVLLDAGLAAACEARMADIVAETRTELIKLTGCPNPNSVMQIKDWVESKGVKVPALRKEDVEKILLNPTTPELVKVVLKKRKLISASSTAKYAAMRLRSSADGRARGCFAYYGAHTGRAAGRGIQLQNLPRIPDDAVPRIAEIANDLSYVRSAATVDEIKMLLRACLIAPQGRQFSVADLSAIEARVVAWLAGEQWVLDAFAEGQDIYKATWSHMAGVPIEQVDGEMRQRGKAATLAFGYGGGVQAILRLGGQRLPVPDTFAEQYWYELVDEYRPFIKDWSDNQLSAKYPTWLEYQTKVLLPTWQSTVRDAYLDSLKRLWRKANPSIVRFWHELDAAFLDAAFTRSDTQVGRLWVLPGPEKQSVRLKLPSGRSLYYYKVRQQTYTDDDGKKRTRTAFTHSTGMPETTWGGKLTENVTQAVARDVLRDAMLAADAEGAEVVLHVHDEIGAEGTFDLEAVMSRPLDWAPGLPLAAHGVTTARYLGH